MQVDTNVYEVQFSCLQEDNKDFQMATGEPTRCSHCDAILNMESQIQTDENGKQFWQCEFCGHQQPVDIEEGEIPDKQQVSYLLESSAQQPTPKPEEELKELEQNPGDGISVVFCLDISGSMDMHVPGAYREVVTYQKPKKTPAPTRAPLNQRTKAPMRTKSVKAPIARTKGKAAPVPAAPVPAPVPAPVEEEKKEEPEPIRIV